MERLERSTALGSPILQAMQDFKTTGKLHVEGEERGIEILLFFFYTPMLCALYIYIYMYMYMYIYIYIDTHYIYVVCTLYVYTYVCITIDPIVPYIHTDTHLFGQ